MGNDELKIEGLIYHGPGNCPICSSPLFVVDSELTLMELNSDGYPISEDTTIRCEAVCSNCGHKQKMMRWNGTYIPYTRSSLIIKKMEFEDMCKDRLNELNSQAKDKNPFEI